MPDANMIMQILGQMGHAGMNMGRAAAGHPMLPNAALPSGPSPGSMLPGMEAFAPPVGPHPGITAMDGGGAPVGPGPAAPHPGLDPAKVLNMLSGGGGPGGAPSAPAAPAPLTPSSSAAGPYTPPPPMSQGGVQSSIAGPLMPAGNPSGPDQAQMAALLRILANPQ